MIENDIKLLEHCVLDLQHRVQALEKKVKQTQRRVTVLECKADRKTEPQTDGYMTAEQAEDYRKMLDKAEHKVYGNIEDEPQTEGGRVMNDTWNLGDGLENVCRSVLRKAHYASHQTEEKPRTIINLDAYEITALIWAMNEYIHNGQFAERI